MTFDRVATVTALKFFCGADEKVCRLCLRLVEERGVYIEDSVTLQKPYYEGTVTYLDMLEELRVSTDLFLPNVLCSSCMTAVTNAYLFEKLCDYSTKTWTGVLDRLSNCLNDTDMLKSTVKAVYLVMQESSSISLRTRKDHKMIKKKDLLLNLKRITTKHVKHAKDKKKTLNNVECKECGKMFSSTLKLLRHDGRVHKKTKNACTLCPKVFTSLLQLEYHAEKIHYAKKLKCPKCNMMFSTKRILADHDKNDHTAAICKLCFMKFPSKRALRFHLDRHDVFKCSRCSKTLSNKHTYKSHLKLCGNLEDKSQKFFCDLCGKGYVRKNGIRSHLKTDHGFGNVLSCKWCGKKFDAISKLRNHIVKHTKEKNFYCEVCGNRFVTHAALVYHVRLHTGEKPFPCDMCDESFLSTSRRMEHKRRKHFGPTKECPVCPMKFVVGTQLRKHLERHNNPHSKLYIPDMLTS